MQVIAPNLCIHPKVIVVSTDCTTILLRIFPDPDLMRLSRYILSECACSIALCKADLNHAMQFAVPKSEIQSK